MGDCHAMAAEVVVAAGTSVVAVVKIAVVVVVKVQAHHPVRENHLP